MLSYDAGVELSGPRRPPQGLGAAPLAGCRDQRGRRFAALSETPLASRFFGWQGLSGDNYVFSVYSPSACPAFCDAVLLAVARDDCGRRRILIGLDTGAFPEPVVARAARDLSLNAETLEFHVHLLARSSADRRAVLADLEAASSVIFRRHAA